MPRSKSPVARRVLRSKSPVKISHSSAAAAVSTNQTVHHHVEVERPGFFSNVWQGFGLGAGQAIAHNVFRSDPEVKVVHEHVTTTATATATTTVSKDYVQCMKDNKDDKDLCKQFLG
jgi:hypothetical protein